jgi:hypothetical protein
VLRSHVVHAHRVGEQDGSQPRVRGAGSVGDRLELIEVLADGAGVPRVEDRIDVGEVLVQRRAADARLFGDA